MCDMSDSLEASWESNVALRICFFDFGEPIENLLVVEVLEVELEFGSAYVELVESALLVLHFLVSDIFLEQNQFGLRSEWDDSWQTR